MKVYDKFSRVLRVETTVNDVSFFKHHRKVEHKDRHITRELAPLKKTIYSLIDLREILLGCNQRYLAFLSSLDDTSAGQRDLQRLSQPRVGTEPGVKGLNFFNATEQMLLRTLQRGEFNIHGWRRADLLTRLATTASAMSRQLTRLCVLGLIKKVSRIPIAITSPAGAAQPSPQPVLSHASISFPHWPLYDEFFSRIAKTELLVTKYPSKNNLNNCYRMRMMRGWTTPR